MGLCVVVSLVSIFEVVTIVSIDEGVEGEDDKGDDEVDGDEEGDVDVDTGDDDITVDSDDKGEAKVDDTGNKDGCADTGVVDGTIDTGLIVVVVVLVVEGLGFAVEPSAGVSSNGTSLPLTKASEIWSVNSLTWEAMLVRAATPINLFWRRDKLFFNWWICFNIGFNIAVYVNRRLDVKLAIADETWTSNESKSSSTWVNFWSDDGGTTIFIGGTGPYIGTETGDGVLGGKVTLVSLRFWSPSV